MSTLLTFHVPPDASPEAVRAIFHVLISSGNGPLSPATLKGQVANMLGRQPRGEALTLLRDLRLIAQTPRGLELTARGAAVAASAEAADLVHGLSYFAWSPNEPQRLSRMWTYRVVVDQLWDLTPVTINPALKKQLVEEVLARAEIQFAGTDGFTATRASVGPKSVDGVLRWLEQLIPPVLRDRQLMWRQRCSPTLMVLALSATAMHAGAAPGADFRLGPEERTLLSRACFLDPLALDAMLDWTVQTQPQYVRWGTLNARYGRQVVITEPWPA
jgi:hypothetical protein